jgi:hypothetical protein
MSSRDRAKTKNKKKKKKKNSKSLQIKGKLTFWLGKDTSTSKILFDEIPFSPPPSYYFKNPFHIIEKVLLTPFGTSFSLAIYMTWVIPFLLIHELHIFSL